MSRIFQKRTRDKLYIIAEILDIAEETNGVLKTQIMYRANLSYTQLNDYLEFLLKNGLLTKVVLDNKKVYKTTPKGIQFLQSYREITELLRTEQENAPELVQIQHKEKSKGESTR
jgi:predicted transcriptional regulator